MSYKLPKIIDVMNSPSSSYWLQAALKTAIIRDPVDAMSDAELLYQLLKKRADAVIGTMRTEDKSHA